jgi:hypothetical protein
LRFAHKTRKNRLFGDFLPCKLRKQPDNRGFYVFSTEKHKNLQVQQAARKAAPPTLYGPPGAVLLGFWKFFSRNEETRPRRVIKRTKNKKIHGKS